MVQYNFQTREFGVSESGFHLLRSGFNYETLSFEKIDRISVGRGRMVNNWIAILIAGVALVSFSIYYAIRLSGIMSDPDVNVIYIEEIIVPVLPFFIGLFCLYSSTRNGTILRITTIERQSRRFPLADIEKAGDLPQFQEFLRDKTK
jgi:hypothetical protein